MIFVTGGTGLVGSHLLLELAKCGEKVRALKRKSSHLDDVRKVFSFYNEKGEECFSKIEWVEGDITNINSLLEAMNGVEKVYHCAAIISFFQNEVDEMMKVNVEGTANIVNVCLEKKIKKLCYVSSVASLGIEGSTEVITEETHWKMSPHQSNYSISKYGAEREVWRGIEEGLNAVIVNPAIILGAGNWHRGSQSMFHFLSKGNRFYPNGSTGYVDVRDVVKAMTQLMESEIKNERFILVSENLSYKNFLGMVQEKFGVPKPSIKTGKTLLEIGRRLDKLISYLKRKQPRLTKETIRAGNEISIFSNLKIKNKLDFVFIPVKKSVEEVCALYKKDGN